MENIYLSLRAQVAVGTFFMKSPVFIIWVWLKKGHMSKNIISFSSYIKVYVFETDDFVIKKYHIVKEKYFQFQYNFSQHPHKVVCVELKFKKVDNSTVIHFSFILIFLMVPSENGKIQANF